MKKVYRRTIRTSSPSDYRRKVDSAVRGIQREVVKEVHKDLQKILRKH